MKRFILAGLFVILFNSSIPAQNQGINNHWILGYNGHVGNFPWGNPMIDFYTGMPLQSHIYLDMEFRHTHANISDDQGNLLFYTNGVYIADATHDTMMNGGGINPGPYAVYTSDGMLISQGALALKKPGWNNLYFLFHSTCSNYGIENGCKAFELYVSVVDLNLQNGLGEVILKNQQIIIDTLNTGKIAATKHANGRDWWVMVHRVNSDKFYKLLITPYGIEGPYPQNIGIVRNWDAGQAWFSPDGSRYAYFYINGGLEIFDFDRCTGMLSNPVHINIPYQNGFNVGIAFSPNSDVLYVSNVTRIYQLDLTSANIAASLDTIAWYDGFLDTTAGAPPLATGFGNSILAPDGKIYITTGNSTRYFHTIDNPDVLGTGCNVNQHSFQLTAYNYNTIPNHPNYFLGKIPGSPCDTVIDVGIDPHPPPPEGGVGVFPNPSNGVFTLSFPVQSEAGVVEVYDVNGRLVHKEYVSAWSQFKRVDVSLLPNGVYMCRIRWPSSAKASEDKVKSVRVIISDRLR